MEMDREHQEVLAKDEVKAPRFQVNNVSLQPEGNGDERNVLPDPDDIEDDEYLGTYAKSFRHFTREVLPRISTYRNVMSVHAVARPTLEELRGAVESRIADVCIRPMTDKKGSAIRFGWVKGVLIRNLLNIWGVMLFIRLAWVVGQAGVLQGILLIGACSGVTLLTALSVSAISTNGIVKGGGTYFMISRSLGPEFGASIGLIFSLANAVATGMYVLGFCDSVLDLMIKNNLIIIDGDINDKRLIGTITLLCLVAIVIIGIEWEAKAQVVLFVILITAICDILLGCFMGPQSQQQIAKGFVGFNNTVLKNNLFSDYRTNEGKEYDFFSVFGVFFPAACGFLAGANISGDLRDPATAIPKGTILSIVITMFSYFFMALLCGWTVLRDASGNVSDISNGTLYDCKGFCPYGLHNSDQVMELISAFGPLIYAGCFAATLSSALASLVSAPKVFQALSKDKLYPYISIFATGYGKNEEPIYGYLLTFFIALAAIIVGHINAVAPLISNFFLAAYALINFSTFHASFVKPVGWRPQFRYYNVWLSLIGSCLCLVVMFIISWSTSLVTLGLVLTLYFLVLYRKPEVNWGSTTQAQTYNYALNSLQLLNRVEDHVKNYRAQILLLCGKIQTRAYLVDFAHAITKNKSLLVCAYIENNRISAKSRFAMTQCGRNWLSNRKIKAFYIIMDSCSFEQGCHALFQTTGLGKLKPNIVMLGYKYDWENSDEESLEAYFNVIYEALGNYLAVAIYRDENHLNIQSDDEDVLRKSSAVVVSFNNSPQPSNTTTPTTSRHSEYEGRKEEDENKHNYGHKEAELNYVIEKPLVSKKGNIDVWWLYDDGGLTLLLPYVINTRKSWTDCKLRVFALANKKDNLAFEQRSMASLLSKFRIDYADLKIIPDITKKPSEETLAFFDEFVKQLTTKTDKNLSDLDILAMKDKTNRHLRLRELLHEHSLSSTLVVMTLPMPRKDIVSATLYMVWLELLTKDMPPFLLVRGNQQSVLTFYS